MSVIERGRQRDSREGRWVPFYRQREQPATPSTPPQKPPDGSQDNEQQEKAAMELREKSFNLQGTVTPTYANPHIYAGAPINIQGVGSVFSGLYLVTSVKHNIDSTSGYTQTIQVSRDATGVGTMPNVAASQSASVTRLPKPEASSVLPKERYHVVKQGDTLWAIAKKYLGQGSLFPRILAVNPAITDPARLSIGTRLLIPPR